MRRLWLAAVMGLTACSAADLQVFESFTLGSVGVGGTATAAFSVQNVGGSPATVTISLSSDEFAAAEQQLTVPANGTASVDLRFTPKALGPRTATMTLQHGDASWEVALSGVGTGAGLSTADAVTLTPTALVPGQPPPRATGELVLRNAGTIGSVLHVAGVTASDGDLCVGAFTDGQCAGFTAAEASVGTVLHVPLSAQLDAAGTRTWTVTIHSDDPVAPARQVQVTASAETFEACQLDLPAELTLTQTSTTVSFQHAGTGSCLLQVVRFDAAANTDVRFNLSDVLPARLDASHVVRANVSVLLGAADLGTLHVESAGAAPRDIPVHYQPDACLLVTPTALSFGTVREGCSAPSRTVSLFNSCAHPIELQTATLSSPGLDFHLSNVPAQGSVVAPNSASPLQLTVSFTPQAGGTQTQTLVLRVEATDFLVTLTGTGEAQQEQVDTFSFTRYPRQDAVVVVDTSPSFAPRRAEVRASVSSLLSGLQQRCGEARVAFLPAEGAEVAVDFARGDAGQAWTWNTGPDFVARALETFDALPASSEEESCVAPLAAALPDAGVRADEALVVACYTDALEQTRDAGARLDEVAALTDAGFSFSAVVGFPSSTCALEAPDDGTWAQLVLQHGGQTYDVCQMPLFGVIPEPCRNRFFLTAPPAMPPVVRLDGAAVPLLEDGGVAWFFDTTENSLVFDPSVLMTPGTHRITASYTAACVP